MEAFGRLSLQSEARARSRANANASLNRSTISAESLPILRSRRTLAEIPILERLLLIHDRGTEAAEAALRMDCLSAATDRLRPASASSAVLESSLPWMSPPDPRSRLRKGRDASRASLSRGPHVLRLAVMNILFPTSKGNLDTVKYKRAAHFRGRYFQIEARPTCQFPVSDDHVQRTLSRLLRVQRLVENPRDASS